MLYEVLFHNVFITGHRVYSPVAAGEGMEESLAIATGRGFSGDCEAAVAASGRREGAMHMSRTSSMQSACMTRVRGHMLSQGKHCN